MLSIAYTEIQLHRFAILFMGESSCDNLLKKFFTSTVKTRIMIDLMFYSGTASPGSADFLTSGVTELILNKACFFKNWFMNALRHDFSKSEFLIYLK